jgi:hypothetical protein
MIRQAPYFAVCLAAWLSVSTLVAQETLSTLSSSPAPVLSSGKVPQKDTGDDFMIEDEPMYAEPDTGGMGLLAASAGATPGGMSGMPGMIGDFFSTGYRTRLPSFGQSGHGFENGTTIGVAGGDRRFKISDNNSPFPVDRVFFNYHHFHNAVVTGSASDASVDRGMFGIEKTFINDLYSVELRLPFASGLNADQDVAGDGNLGTEFGNLGIAMKRLVYRSCTVAASVGLGMVTPTAKSTTLTGNGRTLRIDNNAFYLQPFFGVYWAPNNRLFTQFFMQADFDTVGNRFTFDNGDQYTLQDQDLLFTDFSAGYWVYRNPCRWFSGLAPMIELHHTTTLQDTDAFGDPSDPSDDSIANYANRQDFLNLTGGLRFEFGGRTYLTASGVAPLSTGDNKAFDAEFSVELVRLY